MPTGQGFAEMINGREFTFGRMTHQAVYIEWRGNYKRAGTAALPFRDINRAELWKALFVVDQLFLPRSLSYVHMNDWADFKLAWRNAQPKPILMKAMLKYARPISVK